MRALVLLPMGVLVTAGCASTPPYIGTGEARVEPATIPPEVLARSLPPARTRILEIDLDRQGFRYLEDGRLVRTGPVSAGTPEHPTPAGSFRILSKDADKVSNSYTNAFEMPTPMPYSLQFYGSYFIHEGWVPGYPDSHGCVRLHYEDARFLFERMRPGDAVVITDSGNRSGWLHATAADPTPRRPPRGEWLAPGDPRRGW